MRGPICILKDCEDKHKAWGYCSKHYQRWRRTGDPLKVAYNREVHGFKHTSEYNVWISMKRRCLNKNNRDYKYYGGRGITVCDRWKNSFIAFYQDMGKRPTAKHQIDRIDNDGNYTPENCRWVTCTENIRNSSKAKLTMEKAREIRRLHANGILRRIIAKLFGVTVSNIDCIIGGRIWVET